MTTGATTRVQKRKLENECVPKRGQDKEHMFGGRWWPPTFDFHSLLQIAKEKDIPAKEKMMKELKQQRIRWIKIEQIRNSNMLAGMEGEAAGGVKGCDRDLNCDRKPEVEQVEEELNVVMREVGLESRRGLVRSSYVIKDKHVMEIKVAINRETTETVKVARDTKDEATIAATRQLMSKLQKRYFPYKYLPDAELVSYKAQLEEFCRMTKKRGAPSYITDTRDGKYYSKVEVEGLSCVEGGSSAFLAEAQGAAAKGWLLLHGGNWKEVLAGRGKDSTAFGTVQGGQVFVDALDAPIKVEDDNSVIDLTKAGDDVQKAEEPVVDLTSSPIPLAPPAAPRRALECPLCLEELRDLPAGQSALSTPCGHLFCSGCLPAALAAAGRCPTCRVAVTADQAIRLFL